MKITVLIVGSYTHIVYRHTHGISTILMGLEAKLIYYIINRNFSSLQWHFCGIIFMYVGCIHSFVDDQVHTHTIWIIYNVCLCLYNFFCMCSVFLHIGYTTSHNPWDCALPMQIPSFILWVRVCALCTHLVCMDLCAQPDPPKWEFALSINASQLSYFNRHSLSNLFIFPLNS